MCSNTAYQKKVSILVTTIFFLLHTLILYKDNTDMHSWGKMIVSDDSIALSDDSHENQSRHERQQICLVAVCCLRENGPQIFHSYAALVLKFNIYIFFKK
jgi:hypothetical protein